jgi:DNA polymerase alpha-associated DNA helicase A
VHAYGSIPVCHSATIIRMAFVIWLTPRMHTEIAEFPSKVMYDSRLITHPSVASHLLRDLPNITTTSDDDILETPVVFFDTAGCEYFEKLEGESDEGSRCNENEATIVHNWVESLVRDSVLAKRLGLTSEID